MKRRHHFVPRFYLGAFESASRRIHVYNIHRQKLIPHASLRDQCHKHRLYGATDDLEDALSEVEGVVAPILRRLTTHCRPPQPRDPEHAMLLLFLGFQMLRTVAAAEAARAASSSMANAAFDDAPPPGFVLQPSEAIYLTLGSVRHLVQSLDDLAMHALIAPSGTLLATSDNPVFKYNLYCEGVRFQGVTGTNCKGFALFFPVSPAVALLLYDSGTYKVGSRKGGETSHLTMADVDHINAMQFVSAGENVYFSASPDPGWLRRTAGVAATLRRSAQPRVHKADEVGGTSMLIHQYYQMPNLQLRLSFLSIKRNARRVPLNARPNLYRRSMPPTREDIVNCYDDGECRRFITRKPA